MDRSHEYRRNAKLCQEMATSARNESDKRQWLELAESWLRMIWPAKHTRAEEFEMEASKKGTEQHDPDASP
jgi:hypothetical protein